jgi:ABC-type antimicrobial peptide transport system permease subunit
MRGGGYWDGVRTAEVPEGAHSGIHHVTAGFPGALGVPLVAGRELTVQEISGGKKVALISENLARELGLLSPLGARISVDDQEYEVVGVARQARYAQLVDSPPVAYVPFDYERQSATVVIRTAVSPMAVLGAINNVVKELDPNLPLVDVYTMEEQISRTLQRERLFAWLCGSFGVLALVLCVVGLYGLMSHTTARRTPEMGIRIALGASRGDVIAQVLWEGMRLAAAGLVLGVPLALYGVHLAEAQEVLPEGTLPYWTLAAAIGVLALSAGLAVLAPALRASSVEPMRALRQG